MSKKSSSKTAATKAPESVGSNINKWGNQDANRQIRIPSGAKLVMKEDELGILKYIGQKDISEKVGKPDGEVIYNAFHDGKRVVNLPMSYAFSEYTFEEGDYYYIHNAGDVQTRPEFNAMKDFEIVRLGTEGEETRCDEQITGSPTITLTLAVIADLNYNRLNYPLRRV